MKIGKTNFCSVVNCTCHRFINTDAMIKHLQVNHNQTINVTAKSFPSMDSFMQWKEEFETNLSSFVLHSSPKQGVGYKCYYHYYNRTGNYSSRGEGKRGLEI